MEAKYLSAADTAKLVRVALKRGFPGTRFSVRTNTYAGGASIDVDWVDGPAYKLVEGVARQFAGSRFDGMIDMKVTVQHWLLPDGTATVASNEGTEGAGGAVPAAREWMPHPDARLVRFSADFIFPRRRTSLAFVGRVLDRMKAQGLPVELLEVKADYDGTGYIAARSRSAEAELWEREARNQVSRFMTVRAA